jgi:hypothetical protein
VTHEVPHRAIPATIAAALALALVGSACGPGPVAPEFGVKLPTAGPSPTPIDVSKIDNCLTPETQAFGLGLKKFLTEAEARAALGNVMLFPDPSTLPADASFDEAYFNAAKQGLFTQSTIGLTYHLGTQTKPKKIVTIFYVADVLPFTEPPEPHGRATIRGGKTAWTFDIPWVANQHSIQWLENCRKVSVIADLPADQVKRIAEGLRFPGTGK